MKAAAALLLLVLAGCTGPPPSVVQEEEHETPALPTADVYLYLRIPHGFSDAFHFAVNITGPDGAMQSGAIYTDHINRTICVVGARVPGDLCCSTDRASGDLHCRDLEVSMYPYALVENVTFNGTWTIQIERTYSYKNYGGLTGLPGQEGGHCMHVRFSNPGLSFAAGGSSHPESDCTATGTLLFEYGRDWTDPGPTLRR